jgi:hypothetical protein
VLSWIRVDGYGGDERCQPKRDARRVEMESAVSGVSLPASFAWPLFIFWVCERLDSESLQQAGAKTWRPPTTQPGHRHVASRRRAAGTRVRKTGGNRSGSTGSRWNRSGPVHEPVRFPPKNRAYKFAIPVNRSVSPVNRSVFADSRKPLPGGFVNPGRHPEASGA